MKRRSVVNKISRKRKQQEVKVLYFLAGMLTLEVIKMITSKEGIKIQC